MIKSDIKGGLQFYTGSGKWRVILFGGEGLWQEDPDFYEGLERYDLIHNAEKRIELYFLACKIEDAPNLQKPMIGKTLRFYEFDLGGCDTVNRFYSEST